jgi:hypothetical protein
MGERRSIRSTIVLLTCIIKMRYHRAWLDALDFAHKKYQHEGDHHYTGYNCVQQGLWDKTRSQITWNLGANPSTLRDLQVVFGPSEKLVEICAACRRQFRNWRSEVQSRVDKLPKFSTLL